MNGPNHVFSKRATRIIEDSLHEGRSRLGSLGPPMKIDRLIFVIGSLLITSTEFLLILRPSAYVNFLEKVVPYVRCRPHV